ncbi:MAG: sulfurtransferase TusA family protein [Anaerolineae bacterium]
MTNVVPLSGEPQWQYDTVFDGGDKGCGDLILDLRLFFKDLAPGTRVVVVAHDPGAPIDLPAWCRLTGHQYLAEAPPHYLIQRR